MKAKVNIQEQAIKMVCGMGHSNPLQKLKKLPKGLADISAIANTATLPNN